MSLLDLFKHLGHLIGSGFSFAHSKGLDDKLISVALDLVKSAASNELTTNDQKREFAVSELSKQTNASESVSRLAVELAVQAFKALPKN